MLMMVGVDIGRGPLNLAPWLYIIPGELAPFSALFTQLGARESFTAEQYISTLGDIVAAHGTSEPLPAPVLEQALSIIQACLGSRRCCSSAGSGKLRRPCIVGASRRPCVVVLRVGAPAAYA